MKKGKGNKQEVIVSIRDTDTGIDSEILPRLFSKFATKSVIGGIGLGLFISKSIIEAHGGKMSAENMPLMAEQKKGYLYVQHTK